MPTTTYPNFAAFLAALNQPLNTTGANSATIDLLPGQQWNLPISNLSGGTASLAFGFDAQLEVDLFNNAKASDADGVLGPRSTTPSGQTDPNAAFTPITPPPFIIYNTGDVWLKARLLAQATGSLGLNFSGVAISASGDVDCVAAIYKKIAAPAAPGTGLPPDLFTSVLAALVPPPPPPAAGAAPALPLPVDPATVIAFQVGAGMKASLSVDLVKLLAAIFGGGVPALTLPKSLPFTANLGLSAVINASYSCNSIHTVAFGVDPANPGFVKLWVALADQVNSDEGVSLAFDPEISLDPDFYASLQQVLTTVTNAINWDPATLKTLVNNPTFASIVDLATQTQVKLLLTAFAAWLPSDATAPIEKLFADAKTFVTSFQTTLQNATHDQIKISLAADYAVASKNNAVLTADLPAATAYTYLPALLAGDLTGVQADARAGRVLNCTTLAQILTTKTSTLTVNFDLIAFDSTTKYVIEDAQAEIDYLDSQNNKTSQLALRRTWIGDNTDSSVFGNYVSTENNVALLPAQSQLNPTTNFNTFDELQLKFAWRTITTSQKLAGSFGIAADCAAVLGLIPFANIPAVAASLQQAGLTALAAAPAKIQIDAAWTIPLETYQNLVSTIAGFSDLDLAAACANAMPWNHYGDESPVVFKVDDTYRSALTEIWRQLLAMSATDPNSVTDASLNERFLTIITTLKNSNSPLLGPVQDIYNYQAMYPVPPPIGSHVSSTLWGANQSDVKFLSLIRACRNATPNARSQSWKQGIARLNQGLLTGGDYLTIIEGPTLAQGAFDLVGNLCLNTFLSRIQASLVLRAFSQFPGLLVPKPTVTIKSLDGTPAANVLQTQVILPS